MPLSNSALPFGNNLVDCCRLSAHVVDSEQPHGEARAARPEPNCWRGDSEDEVSAMGKVSRLPPQKLGGIPRPRLLERRSWIKLSNGSLSYPTPLAEGFRRTR
jgi:hypothetical protein